MINYVLSIDPGLSTGIALLSYDDETPAQLVQGWQFGGGVAALRAWRKTHWRDAYHDSEWGYDFGPRFSPDPHRFWDLHTETLYEDQYNPDKDEYENIESEKKNLTIICEKFTARATKGFSYTTASLEPLRCEGALIDRGIMPDYTVAEKRWRDPSLQYFSGGSGKAERKKKQHAFLKANDFYRTGKDFGTADADDFRSATAHGVNYIARELKHKLTFELIANGQVAF